MELLRIADELVQALRPLRFGKPVTYVYNPLEYARQPHEQYLRRYGKAKRQIVLLGMNPGPWGMAQTGVPFGQVTLVRNWLGIDGKVNKPAIEHPKRPIQGFDCQRSEVSGSRIWGWARDVFSTPERFFQRFFVANYCPLLFLEKTGKNRTPDKLPTHERKLLFAACDRALRQTIEYFEPRIVVGIGNFAEKRACIALEGLNVRIGRVLHPSPASPAANRGWAAAATADLAKLGITFERKP